MRPFSILLLASPLLASPFLLTPSFLGAGTAAFITLVTYHTFYELVFLGFLTRYSTRLLWLLIFCSRGAPQSQWLRSPLFWGWPVWALLSRWLGSLHDLPRNYKYLMIWLGAVVKVTRVVMICQKNCIPVMILLGIVVRVTRVYMICHEIIIISWL